MYQKYNYLFFLIISFFTLIKPTNYQSQCGQDKYLHETIFKNKKNGFFVDIGAHDGIRYSNTYFFEQHLDWKGICIEPIPAVFKQLINNRSCSCLNGCISNFNGIEDFVVVTGYAEMLSGLLKNYDPQHLLRIDKEIKKYGGNKSVIKMECYTLATILNDYSIASIDYLSIDTEGSELEVLQGIDFDSVSIKVISIENNYKNPSINKFLLKRGYRLIKKLGSDEIYLKIII